MKIYVYDKRHETKHDVCTFILYAVPTIHTPYLFERMRNGFLKKKLYKLSLAREIVVDQRFLNS